jgi:nicotinamide-nucleotide amidase
VNEGPSRANDQNDVAVRSAVIAVGDELLLGQTVDTNGAWLGARLAELGAPVTYRSVVGDVEDDIRGEVTRARLRTEVTFVCGGLGPTPDDRTREAVAAELGIGLVVDPLLLDALEQRFKSHGFDELPPDNASQAMMPVGGLVLPNDRGTAPGLVFLSDDAFVILLPGPPREMRWVFDRHVEPLLLERLGPRLVPPTHRLIRTTGIAESVLSERIQHTLPEDLGPVGIAFLPRLTGVDIRLTVRSGSTEAVQGWLDRVEEAIAPVVERYRYDSDHGDLVESLNRELRAGSLTVSTAESCTGGLVARRLTEYAGASDVFLGGVVAYSNQSKIDLLGVDSDLLVRDGAVSEPVVRAMALGACERFGSDASIAVTGVAGPGGGTKTKPVGTVWYAARHRGHTASRVRRFPGDRSAVRERSAQAALALLYDLVIGRGGDRSTTE